MKKGLFLLMAVLGVFGAGNNEALATVTFNWATVGDAGNAADTTTYGAVSSVYNIATTEVNLIQYTEFLNAVDPNGLNLNSLYNGSMATDLNIAGVSFTSGAAAGSKYAVIGSGLRPVTYVSWNDSARFVNWLQNGQGAGSTENGVYNMSLGTPTRSLTAGYWIPSEDEWYKAAYYAASLAGGAGGYWLYPMQTNTVPYSDQAPGSSSPNAAMAGNFYLDTADAGYNDGYAVTGSTGYSSSENYLTDGGAYTSADSFYGTYDQGGNVWEWNDTVIAGSSRGLRGGSWDDGELGLRSSSRGLGDPTVEYSFVGFRVASSVPEPSTAVLIILGGAALLARKRRRITL